VVRELGEETGLEGRVIESLGRYRSLSRLGCPYEIEAFRVELLDPDAPIKASEQEHQEVRWEPRKDAWRLPLAGSATRALITQSGLYWPLAHVPPLFPDEAGRFGTVRRHDIHTGVDLYCDPGAAVLAMEEGLVINIEPFTGPEAESPWWNSTQAILVKGASGVLVYGEVESKVRAGQRVEQGQMIGEVRTVLTRDKGRPMTMLHFELMTCSGTDGREPVESNWWKLGEPKPGNLEDPTGLLIRAAGGKPSAYSSISLTTRPT
jgi:murein DD-endopeptidase MepM/ murein hydrolase activator NlpD